MTRRRAAYHSSIIASVLSLSLTACGGGGGANSTPAPPSSATPTPSPAPTPTAINFNTAEYQRTEGAVDHGAITAWQDGATGASVTVGVIDTGIDISSPEFTDPSTGSSRISSASRAFGGNSSYQDEDGHGTAVTGILAAARNNTEIMGIAFDATILALRADDAGSCDAPDGCSFFDSDIAAALDRATSSGAKVVNMSLGGGAANATLRAAINRATNAGVIIVISAGNDSTASPDDLAMIATDPIARGLVLIVGSVNSSGVISGFSNRASGAENVYLAARGEGVRSLDLENDPTHYYLFDGTSFSAPQVAGAVALLAQAFPNLTSSQIVQLLLDNATDAGASGTDSVYGRGILDIAAAFAPQGTTSLAGSSTALSLSDNGTLSAPMGDAASTASISTVIVDSYGRAYGVELGRTLRMDSPSLSLAPRLQTGQQDLSISEGPTRITLSIAPGRNGAASVTPLMLSSAEARQARANAAYIATRINPDAQLAIGFSHSAGSLAAMVQGRNEPAFLIALAPTMSKGFRHDAESSFALRWKLGGFGLAVGGESGDALVREDWTDPLRAHNRRRPYSALSVGIDRKMGPAALSLSASHLMEEGTVLGARFSRNFGAGSARTLFLDADLRLDAGGGWGINAVWRQGWTWAAAGGALENGALLTSNSFALDLTKDHVLDGHDRLAFRVSQPLRVSSGGLNLKLPESYNYATGETGYAVQRYNLAPTGRQIDAEAAYSRALIWGDLTANLYYRKDSGNIAWYPDDIGAAVRFTTAF